MNKICQSQKKAKQDVVYTPSQVVETMLELCDLEPGMAVLDPCAGHNMVFYNNFPGHCKKEWCEIEKGKDFFECNDRFDWVIGNPPYSKLNDWLEHTMAITDNFCYIINSMALNANRLKSFQENGFSMTKMHLVQIDWWFGISLIIVVQRNKPSILSFTPKSIKCQCGVRCGRARGGDPNKCSKLS
eukprot:Lithocolla_globosa_v1_NODE_15_length_10543_cov_26.361651.p5 type:complete len:186 gc:universal NODE_15_length_10543_cov_26.361651:810-1367(+)